MSKQITVQELNTEQFIQEKVDEIKAAVGEGMAINALSGGRRFVYRDHAGASCPGESAENRLY